MFSFMSFSVSMFCLKADLYWLAADTIPGESQSGQGYFQQRMIHVAIHYSYSLDL